MPDGSSYDANDPHLLLWVHVAEIQSFLMAHQRYGARPLERACATEQHAAAVEPRVVLGDLRRRDPRRGRS